MSVDIERRVETLEALMAETLRIVNATSLQIERLSEEMRAFKDEMRAFKEEVRADTRAFKEAVSADTRALKEEMRAFKDEISADTRAFKDEISADTRAFKEAVSADTRAFKDEISADTRAFKEAVSADTRALKEEMRAFKDEINADTRAFKEEMRAFRNEMNKRWGELSAKLGLLVENIVAPSVPRVLSQVFACPEDAVESLGLRLRRKHPTLPGRNREFDAVAAGCGYVLIVESKVQLDDRDVAAFAERLPEAREYFPEFADKGYRFVGAVASLYVDPSVVAFAEKLGLIVLGSGDDLMEVLNSPGFTPRAY